MYIKLVISALSERESKIKGIGSRECGEGLNLKWAWQAVRIISIGKATLD